jgi:hypothetical protein
MMKSWRRMWYSDAPLASARRTRHAALRHVGLCLLRVTNRVCVESARLVVEKSQLYMQIIMIKCVFVHIPITYAAL